MITTDAKTRKQAVDNYPDALAVVKIDGGYAVFFTHDDVQVWERNVGKKVPSRCYV